MQITCIVLVLLFTQTQLFCQSTNWVRTNPGGGGAVSMVTGTANGTILSGSDLSGVYKSTDNGQSWTPIGSEQGLTRTHITCLAPHASNGNAFYIGTGAGIFKTTDGGASVTESNIEVVNGLGYVEAIEMCNVNTNTGYAAHHEWWSSNLTFLKTQSGGDSWFIIPAYGLPPQGSMMRMMAHPQNDDIVVALFGKGRYNCSDPWLYKSIDGGWNWTRIALNLGDILDFDFHPTDPQTIYASTFQSNGCASQIWNYVGGTETTGALFKSTNGGNNFAQIGPNTGFINVRPNPYHIAVTNFLFPMNWSTTPPSYNNEMGTWKTYDGGITWAKTGWLPLWAKGWSVSNYPYTSSFYGLNKTVTKDKFNSGNYYAAYGGWAWTTTNTGDNFTNVATKEVVPNQYRSTGMDNINGNGIDVCDQNPNIIYVGYYDLGFWYSKDKGQTWTFSIPDANTYPDHVWGGGGGSNANFVLSDPARENVVWSTFGTSGTSTDGAVFKSTAYGENWQISNTGLQYIGNTTHGMSLDVNSPSNNRTLFVTQDGNVFKSTDDGASWFSVLNNGGLKFTAIDQFNSQLIYAGGESGLWRSINGGSTWYESGLPAMRYQQQIPNSIMLDDIVPTFSSPYSSPPRDKWNGVFEIKTDPNIANRVYVSVYGPNKGLYRSDDAGVNWTKLYTNDYTRGIAIDPNNSDRIFVSSGSAYHSGGYEPGSAGFLVSENGGQSWKNINGNMSWSFGGRMELDHSAAAPRLWAWSPGTGVQYADVPSSSTTQTVDCSVQLFLEGSFDGQNKMTTALLPLNLLPSNQSYNTPPWNYNGSETNTNPPSNTVDWVLVSLRKTPLATDEIAKGAVLLLDDGTTATNLSAVVDVSITSLYVVVEHRNHLPVLSPTPIPIVNGVISYDFRVANSYTGGGGQGQKLAGTNWLLFAGNADQSLPSGYEISGADNILWRAVNGTSNVYRVEDFNLNGEISGADKVYWFDNNGVFSSVPK